MLTSLHDLNAIIVSPLGLHCQGENFIGWAPRDSGSCTANPCLSRGATGRNHHYCFQSMRDGARVYYCTCRQARLSHYDGSDYSYYYEDHAGDTYNCPDCYTGCPSY